jgi:hypothetical protein
MRLHILLNTSNPEFHLWARFQIVVENAIVDDYVSEKFYEGLKAGSLMVYLGGRIRPHKIESSCP